MEGGLVLDSSATPAKAMNPSSSSKVRVIVRVRPFLPHEIAANNGDQTPCVSVIEQEYESSTEEVVVYLKDKESSRNECYRLDSFFAQEDNNVGRIFYREVSPLIPGLFHGCNATVFAYGATGSGKTYTMQGTDEMPGLMPLAMSTIMSMCQCTGSTVEISYYEVYMDRCYDLLEIKANEIAVLDDKDGQIHLRGLSRVPVKSMPEFYEAFSCGIQRRKVAHTGLNDVSSRSHGVLVIAVSTPCDDGSAAVTGKLNLIDLAGNEDNRRTCNEGIRLQESAKINQSLFALSNVIYALNNNLSRVPYRESKLTRILQDSLGGMSQALMVACLNPGEYPESVHTVSLAARSRHITNFVRSAKKQETPKVKVDMEAKLRAWLESRGKTKSAQRIQAFNSPLLGKTPSSFANVKKPTINLSSVKAKVMTDRSACNAKERNIFYNESTVDSNLKNLQLAGDKEEGNAGAGESVLESNTSLPGEASNQEESSANNFDSSPVSERKSTLRSSLRKALSPLNTNIKQKPLNEPLFTNGDCTLLFEPETPKTPPPVRNNRSQKTRTPLHKFTACGSKLKNVLLKEYIDFLNTANREELLELKGIGVKMAEYIVELRETSPLKSLSDLEKIGLSSKQIVNLFNKAAVGVFDKQTNATPSCSEISQGTDEMPGLMPLAMSTIMSMCQCTGSTVEISYYEVYMDRCYDLLEIKAKEIAVLDDKDGQIHLRGLSRVPVKSMPEFYEAFSCGIQRRKVAHTGLNDVSSRSHGVLVIAVSTPCDDGSAAVTGKLNLIDLAGNEDNRRTCNEGIRLQESAKINQSLFALSNVIYALNNNLSRVPYRESKLTRILQDSLGGMSQALMVACLNPGEYPESVHTVSLAARSRHITNFVRSAKKQETPKVKVDMEAKLRAWLESRGKTKSAQRIQAFNSPLLGKTPSSFANVKKPTINLSSVKAKVMTNRSPCNAKESTITVPFRNIFYNESTVDSNLKNLQLAGDKEEGNAGAGESVLESNTSLPGEASNQEESSANNFDSSPVSERKSTLRSSLRKALSPLNTNIKQKPLNEPLFTNGDCTLLFEPETPKTPPPVRNNRSQKTRTPLHKFTACGSNLKNVLLKEYIDFLNTANREELLELKGIGVKMAEYIVELRETSPLKSLSDLEKIGLSSKQIVNLFNKAAVGVFDKQTNATPSCLEISQVK